MILMNSSSDHVNSFPIFVSVSPPELHCSFPQGTWVARTCSYSSVYWKWAIATAKPVTRYSLCSSFLCWLAGWVLVCLVLASQILFQQTCIAIKADMKLIVCFFWLHPLSYKIPKFRFWQFHLVLGSSVPLFFRIFPARKDRACTEERSLFIYCLAEFFL